MSLMPPIRLFMFKRCTLLAISIFLNREIISPYSRYIKKGLVYIIITDPFNYQFSFYVKYTKLNTCILCNIRSVSLNKYTFLYYTRYYTY